MTMDLRVRARRSVLLLFGLNRGVKRALQISADVVGVTTAMVFAHGLNSSPFDRIFLLELVIAVPAAILVMALLGSYRAVVRYMSFGVAPRILSGVGLSAICLAVTQAMLHDEHAARVAFDYFLMASVLVTLPRQLLRWVYENLLGDQTDTVVIYGAGAAGRQLAMALRGHSRYRVVAFVDDDPALDGARILELPVGSPDALAGWVSNGVRLLLLALPNTPLARRRQIIESLEHLPLAVQTIPDMADLVSGRAKVADLRLIDVNDLLGREPVQPDANLIGQDIRGKVVMVTGAGGSIGSEICRQALNYQPQTLILFDQNEYALYALERELFAKADTGGVVPILGSVCDSARVQSIIERYGVNTLFHAAAYKHVPLVESNVMSAIENNVNGTWLVAKSAVEAGVQSFVLVSTDKAVRPTNVMGASKRLAELGVQALAQEAPKTRLSIVRFGNVLGSSGSVVPLFQSQIDAGGPVTVTHPDVMRYFMTIPEAAQLVIQAGAIGQQGDVFVLDMGEPVNIMELAKRMIRLAGLQPRSDSMPEGDIEIQITGLRPGEKLYEELLISEGVSKTSHPRIARSSEPSLSLDAFTQLLEKLNEAKRERNVSAVQNLLLAAPLHYQPTSATAQDLALAADAATPWVMPTVTAEDRPSPSIKH